ncbi:MAG: dockerin type I domain-containing protein [Chthoniobacterales bacterium]
MNPLTRTSTLLAALALAVTATATPQYQIYDIGVVQVGDSASQGFGASPGSVAVGRSFRSGGTQAFSWTLSGGLLGLPNLSGRSYAVSNSANDSGTVVGTGATTAFGSGRLPVKWQNGVVSQLPLPSGETLGDANSVNGSGVAVGSINAGSTQRGVIYNGANATVITQVTTGGSYFLTAFGINNSGRIVGQGIDPGNAARNVGIVYDMGQTAAFEVGAIPGANGALAFGVSNTGYVVGASMMNQGSGFPFIWSDANGIVAIPLAAGTSQGTARAVNSAGWVVGNDSSAFSIPFLWDGTTTYRLADIIPANSGWDLSMNTSASALGISDSNIIVGTGVYNGNTHAYAMVPLLQLTAAVSRKTHGAAGTFDIPLALTGSPSVECRNTGGNHTIVFTFSNAVVSGSAAITAGNGNVSGSPTFSANTMTVSLSGVTDIQTLTLSLSNVTDGFAQVLPTTALSLQFLVGDVNGSHAVSATDVSITKSQAGSVTSTTFRSDIDAGGSINSTDIGQVKANAGHTLPATAWSPRAKQ